MGAAPPVSETHLLILPQARLAVLATPKAASQTLRAALRPFAFSSGPFAEAGSRHISAMVYHKHWRHRAERVARTALETVAVIRDPLDRAESWYRYRQRKLEGEPNSTRGISFDSFLLSAAQPEPPSNASIGDQARFLGWDGTAPQVDHLFAFDRLDLIAAFLSDRLGQTLLLPHRNASPSRETLQLGPASAQARAAFAASRAAEDALYQRVMAAGGYLNSSER
jgi:hypothetical protein